LKYIPIFQGPATFAIVRSVF